MGILYLLSVAILFILFVIVRKSEKEINIISFICISVVTLFCYNAFICYVLTFFTIPITLWLLSLINAVISILLAIKIFRKKQIQKFTFNKIDILYISLIAIAVLIVSYINFGIPFNIKYETSDPAVHYLTSVIFAESDALMPGTDGDPVYGTLKTRKTVSYVNSGLLMKCFCKELEPMECYNVFVVFGMLTLFLTGATLFGALSNFAKRKEHRLWAFLISLMCMLGYPLNSFLFGFEYLSMGLLVICAILDVMNYYKEELLNINCFITILALLNFGLFSSYYMFVTFVYPAIWIYFYIRNYQKTKKRISKELILLWIITLIVPFILGFIYHIEANIYGIIINNSFNPVLLYLIAICITLIYLVIKNLKKMKKIFKGKAIFIGIIIALIMFMLIYIYYPTINIKIKDIGKQSMKLINFQFAENGYIYINLYSNILLLLPLPIYLFYKEWKKNRLKDNCFIGLLVVFTIIFMEILLLGYMYEKVSVYYLSKNYFALWIVLFYCNYKALILLSEKRKYLPRVLIGIYIVLMVSCTIFSDVKMIDDALKNEDETIFSVMEIFGSNKTMLIKEEPKLNQDEIEILMYAREKLDYNTKIEVASEGIQYYWSYVLLRYVNYEPALKKISYGQYRLNLKSYYFKNKINKVDYIIYFNRSQKYNQFKDQLFVNSEIIFENAAGGILKYKK